MKFELLLETESSYVKIDCVSLSDEDKKFIEEYLEVRYLQEVVYKLIEKSEILKLSKKIKDELEELVEDINLYDIVLTK